MAVIGMKQTYLNQYLLAQQKWICCVWYDCHLTLLLAHILINFRRHHLMKRTPLLGCFDALIEQKPLCLLWRQTPGILTAMSLLFGISLPASCFLWPQKLLIFFQCAFCSFHACMKVFVWDMISYYKIADFIKKKLLWFWQNFFFVFFKSLWRNLFFYVFHKTVFF